MGRMAERVRAGTENRSGPSYPPSPRKESGRAEAHGRTIGHRPGRADKRVKTLSREWRARAWSRPGDYPRRGKDVFTPRRNGGAGKADPWVRSPRADAGAEPVQAPFPQGRWHLPAKKQPNQDQTYAQQPKKCHAELVAFLFVRRREDRCGTCGRPGRTPTCTACEAADLVSKTLVNPLPAFGPRGEVL
jgi:hypothetical protein